MRILAVGDSYFAASVFADAFSVFVPEHEISYLQIDESKAFQQVTASDLRVREVAGTPAEIAIAMPDVEILAVHGAPVTEEVMAASSELRLICCARGGPSNVDLVAASARGIPVATAPGKNAEAVADQTMAFLIMLARGFPRAQRHLSAGGIVGNSTFEGAEFFGHDLGGHVLGLVGFGQVGTRVATRARSFGMQIVVFDPYLSEADGTGAEYVDNLDELLKRSDFVSVHARASAENENLFDAAAFAAMKPGAYFVNTARESLVDEVALDAAMASGKLAGVALDVIRPCGRTPHPLLRHENVIITPHIGGATYETLARGAAMLADEIARFSGGVPLQNVITPVPDPVP